MDMSCVSPKPPEMRVSGGESGREEGVTNESKWLPAQLTFGPGFMLLGLLQARAGPEMGWYDWVNVAIAAAGTWQLSRGLATLLKASRASANEVAVLREQLSALSSQPSKP